MIHNHVKTVSCLVFVAIFSHQLRDANRRGLWFSPVGSTLPIPYSLYILSIILLCVSIKYYLLMNSNIFSLPRWYHIGLFHYSIISAGCYKANIANSLTKQNLLESCNIDYSLDSNIHSFIFWVSIAWASAWVHTFQEEQLSW